MIKKKYMLLLMWLAMICTDLQIGNCQHRDSLFRKSYRYLNSSIEKNKNDSLGAKVYLESWLKKARTENNYKQMVLAYREQFHIANKSDRLRLADSIIAAARHTGDNALIGGAYLTKGIASYAQMESIQALDNYLIADAYISRTSDTYLIHKTKYLIAQTKYYLGYYEEAIALFGECVDYYKKNDDLAYLHALHGLSLSYYSTGRYDRCTTITNEGLAMSKDFGYLEMAPYFVHAEGVNQHFKKNYARAIAMLEQSLPELKKRKDFPNETIAYYYIGKSYWMLNRHDAAVPYFKIVDQSFIRNNYIRPDLRQGYEFLIDYYKAKSDYRSEVCYWRRLQIVDRLLQKNFRYLLGKIIKEYDNKQVALGMEHAQGALRLQKSVDFSVIALLVCTLAYFTARHHRKIKTYKRKFEEWKFQNDNPEAKSRKTKAPKELDILPEVAETIYKNLLKFEKNRKYLEKDMNLDKIAAALHTNQRYATKVIWHYRDKKTIEYITDLKIEYIVERLKHDSKFRNYTNKSLGMEAGFGSTQIFAKSFKAKFGMSPLFFINELKKELEAHKNALKENTTNPLRPNLE